MISFNVKLGSAQIKGDVLKELYFFNKKINKDLFPLRPVYLSSWTNFVKEEMRMIFFNVKLGSAETKGDV
jgi:hypothetical protein